jgi:O-antigen/teichoic acid export membrane protein
VREAGPVAWNAPAAGSASLLTDSAVAVTSRLLLAAVIVVGDVVLARTLGAPGKGAFALLILLSQIVALVLGLGLDRALGVIIPRSRDEARRGAANVLVWTAVIGGAGTVLLAVLAQPAGGPAIVALPGVTPAQSVLGALAVMGEMLFGVGLVALLARRRLMAYNAVRLLRRATLIVTVIALALVSRLQLEAALVLNLLSLGVSLAVIGTICARDGLLGGRPDRSLLLEQVGFGARSVLGVLGERLLFRVDAFLLAALVGVAATGVYSVATAFAETLWYVPSALGIVLFSRAVSAGESTPRTAATMTRLTLAGTTLMALPVALAAPLVVGTLYGEEFVLAGTALQVMLPGIVAYSVVAVLGPYLVGSGAPATYTLAVIAGLGLNIAADLVLIPMAGMLGAALGASIAYTATALVIVLAFVRLTDQTVRHTLIPVRADARLFRRSGRRGGTAAAIPNGEAGVRGGGP